METAVSFASAKLHGKRPSEISFTSAKLKGKRPFVTPFVSAKLQGNIPQNMRLKSQEIKRRREVFSHIATIKHF